MNRSKPSVKRRQRQPKAEPLTSASNRDAAPTSDASEKVLLQELQDLRDTVQTLYAREALLDAVIQSLPIWITVKDTNGRYLLVNQAAADANGMTTGQFVGKTAQEVLRADKAELDALDTLAHMVLSSGRPVERPGYAVKLPNGTEQVRRMIKLPLHDSDGTTLGIIGWSEDITQRVEAETSLDRNRRLLQTLFDVMPHPLSYTGFDRRFRMVNAAFCKALRVRPEDVLGKTILEVKTIPKANRLALWEQTTEIYEKGQATPPKEFTYPTMEGGSVVHQVSKAPVFVGDKLDGIVTLSVDVTELRRAEQEAKIAHQRLKDALESIPAAIYLYDADDKLLLANSMAKTLYPSIAHLMVPGTSFAELVAGVADTIYPDPLDKAQFIDRRLKEFRHIVRQVEQPGPTGQFLLGQDRRTTEGGTVSIRFDITEQKRIQQELERRERQTRTELMLAAELQRHILRELKPPPFVLHAHAFRPSSFVSGDLFHSVTARDGSFLFFIGDATGHGVSAALVTMLVEATLTAMPDDIPLEGMAERLNSRLVAYRLDGMYVSGIFLRIAPDGTLTYANAGHPAALIVGADHRKSLDSSGPPMGWFEGPGYASAAVHLAPGDKVVLLTDGITEWADANGKEFGAAAVESAVRKYAGHSPAVMVEALIAAASTHAGGQECGDDLTLFVFEYQPPFL